MICSLVTWRSEGLKGPRKREELQTEPPSALGKQSRWRSPAFASMVHHKWKGPQGLTCKSLIWSPANHTEIGVFSADWLKNHQMPKGK